MIIGFDANEANVSQPVGVGWYVYYLLQEFKKKCSSSLQFRIFLKNKPLSNLPKPSSNFRYFVIPKKTVWSQIDLPLALFLKHRSLDYYLAPAHYSPRFCPCKTAVVVHDLSYFYYPQDFLAKDLYQLINWTGYSVKKASQIIAVSSTTKQDLLKNYFVNPAKVKVVYNGFSPPKTSLQKPGFELKKPFFLSLGTLQPRKNIKNLVLAFEKLLSQHPDQFLYLAGKKGWLYQDIEQLIIKRKLAKKIVFTDYLNEAEKWYLLNNCQALIVPGLYEGFGLPLLEAFFSGVPVVCSRTGALPEIAGNAALYFNPLLPNEIAAQMEKIISDSKTTERLVILGKKQLRHFSWDKTAANILKILAGYKPSTNS
jgi:glycosyltransferase involved in cell wall biosynthesis